MYAKLFDAYKQSHGDLAKKKIQEDVNILWKQFKADKVNFPKNVEKKVAELGALAAKKKGNLMSFFAKAASKNADSNKIPEPTVADDESDEADTELDLSSNAKKRKPLRISGSSNDSDSDLSPLKKGTKPLVISDSSDDDKDASSSKINPTPAQDKIKAEIAIIESRLSSALLQQRSGLSDEQTAKTIDKLQKDLVSKKGLLKMKQKRADREKKYRKEFKKKLKKIVTNNPEAFSELKIRPAPGRPRIEEDQPELLKAIINIAMTGSAADDRRRSEQIRSCKTLDDLHKALEETGLKLSRTALYLRLQPRSWKTHEGKRHVVTCPVKLCRAQTSLHKSHPDGKFCTATIRSLETVASILGDRQVAFISQDDKARVPIGITAANKQAPLLMSMEYKVTLPDHDWVVAEKHKLIPSVYAGIRIESGKLDGSISQVTYSGPTYVAVRSGKHSSSTAATHAYDFNSLLKMPEFDSVMKVDGSIKPILMISVDGGPDENPRYRKVISHAITHFQSNDLDAIYVFTNAPGRSAFNRCERRMAPLSRSLSGVILPHDHFGSHLNSRCQTMDPDLEKRNFKYAGEVLTDIWSELIIDGYPVMAEYIEPGETTPSVVDVDTNWYSVHVRESQYLLQIVKCADGECCTPMRSDLRSILTDGFLPAPFPIIRTNEGLITPEPADVTGDADFPPLLLRLSWATQPSAEGYPKNVPYDLYCPTLKACLNGRICSACGLYFASAVNVVSHKKGEHQTSGRKIKPTSVLKTRAEEMLCVVDQTMLEWVDETFVDQGTDGVRSDGDHDEDIPVIVNFDEWMTLPWDDDVLEEF